MRVTSAQYASLVRAFDKNQAAALIEYVASQFQSNSARTAVVTNAAEQAAEPTAYTYKVVRALDTDFVIHPTRRSRVSYTAECYVPVTLLNNNAAADVALYVNGEIASNPGETLDVTLALGLSLRPAHRKTFSADVPAGATVNLTSIIVGAGTAKYLYGQETFL